MQHAPKLKVAIVGSGLAGMSTAVELLDQGYEVDIYEQRPFIGGKVASYRDRDGNHIEMGCVSFIFSFISLFIHSLLNVSGGLAAPRLEVHCTLQRMTMSLA